MQVPVVLCDSIRANLAVLYSVVDHAVFTPWGINATVNDGVSDMNTFGTEFSCERLRKRTLCELACGEGGKASRAADGCRGSSDDESWWVRGRGD